MFLILEKREIVINEMFFVELFSQLMVTFLTRFVANGKVMVIESLNKYDGKGNDDARKQ